MSEYYEDKYNQSEFHWGKQPSSIARIFFQMFPPPASQTLIELGCGEGRDAVFFARSGYQVTAFDYSVEGIHKAKAWAKDLDLNIDFFQADINQFRLERSYDVVFSSGALHYIPQEKRKEIITNYKHFTSPGGIHVHMVPIFKPFIPQNPLDDPLEQDWLSGEILTYYHDWKIEYFTEEVQDDIFSDYKFPINRIIAREPSKLKINDFTP
ncbi:MAG: class I SAM-dependent methyltransferase [Anaerolineales bacterium]|jgi:tellurite methyltransferase